jgi:hypothetical protein
MSAYAAPNNLFNPTPRQLLFHRCVMDCRLCAARSARVNSGVRFLLNDLAQSFILTFTSPEPQSYACVLNHLACSEPRSAIESC